MKLVALLAVTAVTAGTAFAGDLKREAWHTPVREYQDYDSVFFPVVDYVVIQKVKIGMTFEQVKELTGFSPINYYIHPDYALLSTVVGEDHYEVAFLHKKEKKVQAISFRRIEIKKPEPNKSTTAQRASRVADR